MVTAEILAIPQDQPKGALWPPLSVWMASEDIPRQRLVD
jgi:hypothetical protein